MPLSHNIINQYEDRQHESKIINRRQMNVCVIYLIEDRRDDNRKILYLSKTASHDVGLNQGKYKIRYLCSAYTHCAKARNCKCTAYLLSILLVQTKPIILRQQRLNVQYIFVVVVPFTKKSFQKIKCVYTTHTVHRQRTKTNQRKMPRTSFF